MCTEVLTQVGGKYQVVILVLIPSVFALLRAGIFLNPIEIRRGILGGWGQGSHTWGGSPTVSIGAVQSLLDAS